LSNTSAERDEFTPDEDIEGHETYFIDGQAEQEIGERGREESWA
jgi:hypothetical protein